MNQLYIAWTAFQRRQVSMEPHCGFELIFLPVERSAGKIRKFLIYLANAWKTLQVLRVKRPRVVWIQLPQVPLMWVALFYRKLINRRAIVIADCHNKMFRAPWSNFPFGISLISSCDMILVHNDDVLEMALSLGIPHKRLLVVEDPPATFERVEGYEPYKNINRPWFVFPASFADDEPIQELFEAAAIVPDVSFLLTGNARNCREPALIADAPANVHLVGYLSREEFDSLIASCDAVVALTRFDGIQLSVCGEAVGAAKPMLISDTITLRRLFSGGSIFVRSDDSSEIASGAKMLMTRLPELREAAKAQKQEITTRWIEQRGKHLIESISAACNAR